MPLGIGMGISPVLLSQNVSAAAPSPLLTNLISYWKLDEASGVRVDSVTATGNDLTDNNTVTSNPGKINLAAQFTAANTEYLSRVSNASLQIGDIDCTFVLWIYLDSKGTFRPFISKTTGASDDREYLIDYLHTSDRIRFFVSSDGTAATQTILSANSFGSPSVSTWYFVVCWYDSVADQLSIQVNDGVVDTTAHAGGIYASNVTFKIGQHENLRWMNGRIDEVGFWKRTLTAAERTQLYNGGAGLSYPFS